MLTKDMLSLITMEQGAFIDPSCTVVDPHCLILRKDAFVGPEE